MIPRSQTFAKGYAISHEEVVRFVMAIIPQGRCSTALSAVRRSASPRSR